LLGSPYEAFVQKNKVYKKELRAEKLIASLAVFGQNVKKA